MSLNAFPSFPFFDVVDRAPINITFFGDLRHRRCFQFDPNLPYIILCEFGVLVCFSKMRGDSFQNSIGMQLIILVRNIFQIVCSVVIAIPVFVIYFAFRGAFPQKRLSHQAMNKSNMSGFVFTETNLQIFVGGRPWFQQALVAVKATSDVAFVADFISKVWNWFPDFGFEIQRELSIIRHALTPYSQRAVGDANPANGIYVAEIVPQS